MSGRFSESDIGPMSLVDIPAGHDAWVVADEPVEAIVWTGVKEWLKPLDTLSERILATLVFTDLVGSTATATRLGRSTWGELRASHEQRARDIVARFHGRNVQSTDDGILAAPLLCDHLGTPRPRSHPVLATERRVSLGLTARFVGRQGTFCDHVPL